MSISSQPASAVILKWGSVAVFVFAALLSNPIHAVEFASGEQVFSRCRACHALARNRVGPALCGVVGRKAGSMPEYPYSRAMADWGKVWTENELSSFLEDPMKARPGTKMGYAGIKNDQERLALIKFLAAAAVNSDLCAADN